MNKRTQNQKILAYCAIHGSITVRDAVVALNINSPTKRFSELRLAGYSVQTVEEVRKREDGSTTRYKRYYISGRGAFGCANAPSPMA